VGQAGFIMAAQVLVAVVMQGCEWLKMGARVCNCRVGRVFGRAGRMRQGAFNVPQGMCRSAAAAALKESRSAEGE
jgi:hypothetical protein